jgi:hypothetical protein
VRSRQLLFDPPQLIGQAPLRLIFADWTETNVDPFASVFLVDNLPAVPVDNDAGCLSARHDAPQKSHVTL